MEKDKLDIMTDRAVTAIWILGVLFVSFLIVLITLKIWKMNTPITADNTPPLTEEKVEVVGPRFEVTTVTFRDGKHFMYLVNDGWTGQSYLFRQGTGAVWLRPTKKELYR